MQDQRDGFDLLGELGVGVPVEGQGLFQLLLRALDVAGDDLRSAPRFDRGAQMRKPPEVACVSRNLAPIKTPRFRVIVSTSATSPPQRARGEAALVA
ncbi:MAG: hypothetical protein IPM35_37205 [Myxococcales bacterium]|nr:hypothetical protein [Myxococcales bacterium]